MNACIGVGRLDEAAALLDAAVAAGVRLDARAYNVLLKGHARAGDPAALAGIMEQMQRAQACAMPLVLSFGMLACRPTGSIALRKEAQPLLSASLTFLHGLVFQHSPFCVRGHQVWCLTAHVGW